MILKYNFEYQSNNDNFITIIDNLLHKKETNYKINRENNNISLFVEDEEDRLIKISDELSKELPISIFLKDFALEVVSQIPLTNYQHTLDSCQKSYCSNCLAEIENKESTNYYNPFINCQVCGTTSSANSMHIFQNGQELHFDELKTGFEFLATQIEKDKKIKVKNSKMEFVLKKLDKLEHENQRVLCNDIDSLSKLTVGSKQKNIALLSLEKPIVDFNINTIYKSSNNINFEKVNVSYPWDLVLYLFSRELLEIGIEFLAINADDDYDFQLVYDRSITPPKVSVTQNRIFVVENNCYNERLNRVYNQFNEASKSQFIVLVDENLLYEKSILNIFFSSKYSDAISLYSPKIDGIIDILKFDLPKSMKELFEEIKNSENGEKLLNSYKEKFPELYEKALNSDISTLNANSISSMWEIASVVLGIENIYSKASHCLLQKGPRIDYKLKSSDKLFNKEFDFVSFIKSGISFKLAGVDEKTIALGYVENYIYFLSDLLDKVSEEFEIDGLSFCGDFIGEDFINKLISKAFNKSVKLYYNKDFPIQL